MLFQCRGRVTGTAWSWLFNAIDCCATRGVACGASEDWPRSTGYESGIRPVTYQNTDSRQAGVGWCRRVGECPGLIPTRGRRWRLVAAGVRFIGAKSRHQQSESKLAALSSTRICHRYRTTERQSRVAHARMTLAPLDPRCAVPGCVVNARRITRVLSQSSARLNCIPTLPRTERMSM
jgi:hypothetical protein